MLSPSFQATFQDALLWDYLKRATIAHSLSLFSTPLSVKCMNHGLTRVSSQRWSEPFAHRKLMKSKCFLLATAISFSSGAWHTSRHLCWLCLFTAQHCWILDSDWLTGVLRLLIHFLFFVAGLLKHCSSVSLFKVSS